MPTTRSSSLDNLNRLSNEMAKIEATLEAESRRNREEHARLESSVTGLGKEVKENMNLVHIGLDKLGGIINEHHKDTDNKLVRLTSDTKGRDEKIQKLAEEHEKLAEKVYELMADNIARKARGKIVVTAFSVLGSGCGILMFDLIKRLINGD